MMLAAKTMALAIMDLYQDPGLIKAARKGFEERKGPKSSTKLCWATANQLWITGSDRE